MAFRSTILTNPSVITTASTNQLMVGPFDIRNFVTFSIRFQNHSGGNMSHIEAQLGNDRDLTGESAAAQAHNWVSANSTTIPTPSALGASGVVLTTAITNAYSYIRFTGHSTATTVLANELRITIAGRTD